MTRLFLFYCYGNDPDLFADAIRQAHARASLPDYPGKPECCIKAVKTGFKAVIMNPLPQNAFIRSDGKPSDYAASARAVAKQLEATILR